MNVLTATESSWSLGVLIGLPVAVLLMIVGVAIAVLGSLWDDFTPGMWIVIGTVIVVCSIGVTAFTLYPYDAEYHQWRQVDGTVAKIDKRLIGSGDKMEDKFVVRFEGNGQQYGCDDTRCAQVVAGDALTLSCKRAWQYTGTDGYDCRFVSTEAAR